MEPLHEPRVAIDAPVRAAGVAVEGIVADRALIEDAPANGLADDDARAAGGRA